MPNLAVAVFSHGDPRFANQFSAAISVLLPESVIVQYQLAGTSNLPEKLNSYDVAVVIATAEFQLSDFFSEFLDVLRPQVPILVVSNSLTGRLMEESLPMANLSAWGGDPSDSRVLNVAKYLQEFTSASESEISSSGTDLSGSRNINSLLLSKVKDLGFSPRTLRIFRNDNVIYLGDVVQRTEAEWLRTPNFGRKSLNETKEILSGMNLRLGMDIPGWPPEDIDRELQRITAAKRVTEIRQERLGATFEATTEFFVVNPSGSSSDQAVAEEPVTQQLHTEVLRKARQFASVARRLDNQTGWQGISGLCDRLIASLNRYTDEIPSILGSLYSAALEIGSFYELDGAIKRGDETYAVPLDAEVRRPLEDLLRSLAPWLRRFPSIKAMDDEAGQFLLPPGNLETPKALINAADQTNLIPEEDAEALSALLDAANRGEFQGSKAGHRGLLSARNMVVAVITLFGGLVLDNYGGKSVLIGKAGSFLSRAEREISELVADLPNDLRAAIELVIRDHRASPKLPSQEPPPGRVDRKAAKGDKQKQP